jgi:hypothetical protein
LTKFAAFTPPFCSACFQAGPEKRYIDFDAAYDGPVITMEDGRKQPIDDLVICEECLQAAFDLLDPQGMKEHISQLEDRVHDLIEDIQVKDRTIQRMGVTTEELLHHPIQRSKGNMAPEGDIPDEVKTFLALRKRERTNKKISEGQKKAHARERASK